MGDRSVLAGIDLTVRSGETMVLIGASGSGKSVLAKCILGLLPIDAGQVLLDGADITHLSASKRAAMLEKFGVLFQRGALFDSFSVWKNVAFGLLEGRKIPHVQAKAIALNTLAKVGLGADVAELLPAELSGGMQKRVALARAIASSPQFLVLDEPVEGLDPIMADIVANFVVTTVRELNATALAITNNIACARKIATRIAVLQDGKTVWNGPAAEIDCSGNAYVERFIHAASSGSVPSFLR